jgi:hypothetical protein
MAKGIGLRVEGRGLRVESRRSRALNARYWVDGGLWACFSRFAVSSPTLSRFVRNEAWTVHWHERDEEENRRGERFHG